MIGLVFHVPATAGKKTNASMPLRLEMVRGTTKMSISCRQMESMYFLNIVFSF